MLKSFALSLWFVGGLLIVAQGQMAVGALVILGSIGYMKLHLFPTQQIHQGKRKGKK